MQFSQLPSHRRPAASLLVAACLLTACSQNTTDLHQVQAHEVSMITLGEKIFNDESLSASGRMSCATRHDKAHAFAQANPEAVPFGGAGLNQPGVRNTPSLHNGRFNTLREVVSFYVRRDTNPEEFYPIGSNGLPQKFNNLPAQFAINVNTGEAPYNRHEGELPALSSAEIDDVVAFLNTLTDGYQP